ncbi:MAG: AAA family ATPase [Polyangiales bacterium]
MQGVSLTVKNFRGLREVRWEIPAGVSALVGPNGAGKSTLLSVFEFLGTVVFRDIGSAVLATGGPVLFKHLDAGDADPVTFAVERGATLWELEIAAGVGGIDGDFGERLVVDGRPQLERRMFERNGELAGQPHAYQTGKSALERLSGKSIDGAEMIDLFKNEAGARALPTEVYRAGRYDIASLRRGGSMIDSATVLSVTGANVWSVLRNWRDRRATAERWAFVRDAMRASFPGLFDDLDFEVAAQSVVASVHVPGRSRPIPAHVFSDGWYSALLSLAAVASATEGRLVAIDEVETALHPHAIRSLIGAVTERALDRDAMVVLATHSPVVLNALHDRDAVFIMEPDAATQPVRLSDHPNREWLQHFAVGDAYAAEEYGAPPNEAA